ncbi:MAG: glycosyltransferase family 2 protein [Planctomycetota bacterium]|nr:glycosyltransferase family 2 protein [Planctomycetota bacterium]
MPLPLSISIVCCNNERTLPRVLESVRGLGSEIVALDSGSTDGTLGLLRGAGARVEHQPWLGYVAQKQAALERCAQPWVLHVDSDESVEPELRGSIERALARDDPSVAGYEVNRKVWYAGGFLHHAWQPEWRLRLVRRGWARWAGEDPHDYMRIIPGPGAAASALRTERLAGDLRHDSISSISEFLAKQAQHARTAANAQHARGRRGSVGRMVAAPLGEFAKQMLVRRAFLDGWRGWVASSASACAVAMKHAALLERSKAAGAAAVEDRGA